MNVRIMLIGGGKMPEFKSLTALMRLSATETVSALQALSRNL